MPVGQHVANTPGLDNGYRVLGSDGNRAPTSTGTAQMTSAT